MKLEITDTEKEVLSNYLLRKITRLEESGLKDSKCYIALASVYYKLLAK